MRRPNPEPESTPPPTLLQRPALALWRPLDAAHGARRGELLGECRLAPARPREHRHYAGLLLSRDAATRRRSGCSCGRAGRARGVLRTSVGNPLAESVGGSKPSVDEAPRETACMQAFLVPEPGLEPGRRKPRQRISKSPASTSSATPAQCCRQAHSASGKGRRTESTSRRRAAKGARALLPPGLREAIRPRVPLQASGVICAPALGVGDLGALQGVSDAKGRLLGAPSCHSSPYPGALTSP